jgi:hypothetical protein
MKLTYAQYRLLINISKGPVHVRPTYFPARALIKLGLATLEKANMLYPTKNGLDAALSVDFK